MSDAIGQDSGHGSEPGMSWGDLLAAQIDAHGTLTAVAWKLVELSDGDDVASVERALRRLRTRGQRDGGIWGQRLLRVFGVPVAVEDRVRWMGLYHTPFTDLPVALCIDQLRLWDRPPVSASRARIWLHLGQASCALRTQRTDDAAIHIARASEALAALPAEYDDARIEAALIDGFLVSHRGTPDHRNAVEHALSRADALLRRAKLGDADRACFAARLVDQRAYQLNKAGEHVAALALYETLPATDAHPFASYRRDSGLAYGYQRAGRTDEAVALVHRAIQHAGDGGYTRLRAMGLLMLAAFSGDGAARERARAIALRLGDTALLERATKGS